MNSQLVSVITTVRNGERYLLEMLRSVYNQTYSPIEHILVDDGSSDSSVSIVKGFIRSHPGWNLKLVETQGIGRAVAINLGVRESTGTLIAILDADDLWHPEKLERQQRCFADERVKVVATETNIFQEDEEIKFEPVHSQSLKKVELSRLLKSNLLLHSSVMMRREVCRYDETRKSQVDYELWLRLIGTDHQLFILEAPLAYHRIHDNQSFEGKMGKAYRWRSYKLKMQYSLKMLNFGAMIYNTLKLGFDFTMPRSMRLKMRKFINV